jgi:AraC-like DNA-binding protein
MPLVVSTADVSVREREEAWRAAVAEVFVPLDFSFPDPRAFRGEISGDVLGTVAVTRVSAGPHRAERTQRHVARTEMPYYKVSMPLRGYVLISQDGREAPLIPGDLAIYDTSRPYHVTFDDTCRLLVLMFPHRELRLPHDAVSAVTARRVSGRNGIGGLVAPLLVNLASRLDELGGAASSARLADNVVDLLGTLYADLLSGAGYRPADPMHTLMTKIRCFIEDNLDDPDLGPESVAAACHISVGYLHKLFRAEGTSVSRTIRERRLEQCRRDLVAPGSRAKAVSAIGAHWGFLDAAHFSRIFKATYGVSPREYRLSRDLAGQVEMSAT